MARRKRRFFIWFIVMLVLGVCAYFGITYAKYKREAEEQKQEASDSWLTVIETDIKYRQQSKTVDMLKCVVKTNEQVDKMFVNINGLGVQYLDFTPSLIQTTNRTYIAHYVDPIDELCSVGVVESQTVTVDLYVEYDGRSRKIDTQKVAVVGSELKVTKAEIEYAQGEMSVSLNGGTIETNAKLDNIFVNIHGIGVEDMKFTETVSADGVYEYTLEKRHGICATAFGDDGTVMVDLYVEYGGRCYKVDTQEVEVKSAWTPFY